MSGALSKRIDRIERDHGRWRDGLVFGATDQAEADRIKQKHPTARVVIGAWIRLTNYRSWEDVPA